jgi:hypothetical protein
MKLAEADRKKLLPLLGELAGAVEDLLLSGLTTASEATRQTLNIAFQEASRLRLLRLGSTLRVANEELGRFTRNEPDFSRKRMVFFLDRAWLLSHGLARALRNGDEAEFARLLWVPSGNPIERLEVVTLGVVKKVIKGAACTFDFRLRAVSASGPIAAGQRLSWACVFPIKPGVDIPAEAYLQLPQKQRFKAAEFLDGKVVVIEKTAVALDEFGGGRVSLTEHSTVKFEGAFTQWEQYQTWAPATALERVRAHKVSPFDLEVEMQEEVVLKDWSMEKAETREDGQTVYPIDCGPSRFEAVVAPGAETKALEELRKRKRRPPLFALMHYERCRMMLQPLSVFGEKGPTFLTISDDKLDRAALLKVLKLV